MKNKIIIILAGILIVIVIAAIIISTKKSNITEENIGNSYVPEESVIVNESDDSVTDSEVILDKEYEESSDDIIVQTDGKELSHEEYDNKWKEVYGDAYQGLHYDFVFLGDGSGYSHDREYIVSILNDYDIMTGVISEYVPEEYDILYGYILEECPDYTISTIWDYPDGTVDYIFYQYNGEIRMIKLEV